MEIRNEIIEKLKEKEINEKIMKVKNTSEIMKIFEEAGLTITEVEAKIIYEAKGIVSNKVSEMSLEELEACSGGIGRTGVLVGLSIASAAGSAASAVGSVALALASVGLAGGAVISGVKSGVDSLRNSLRRKNKK